MPIRPEHRFFYPIDWAQLSAVIRFGRARGCCEGCGRPHARMALSRANGGPPAVGSWKSDRDIITGPTSLRYYPF